MAGERILVVDDEPGVRSALQGILHDEGFVVEAVGSGEAGLSAATATPFDAVLLDVWLPGMDGLETLQRLREARPELEVVMISGHGTIDTAVRATKLGAFDFIEKPLSLERTLLVLRNALRQSRLERRNRQLMDRLRRDTEIVGASATADILRRRVEAAGASEVPVVLRGEPGSGRQTAARRMHDSGRRVNGPFVVVPCAALVGPGAEEALFGTQGVAGKLALAREGSLYLEDVDCLPPKVQRRLATALAAAGDASARPRVIASAAPQAALQAELGQLLEVLSIEVAPLRTRREDVPILADRFMTDLAREYGRRPRHFAPDCLAAMRSYAWPGNVRELQHLVEGLLLSAEDEVIRLAELPERLGGTRSPSEDLYREFASLAEAVECFERYYVGRVLSEEGSDTVAAARRLGLTHEALRARLRHRE